MPDGPFRIPGRSSGIIAILVLLVFVTLPLTAHGQAATIGIYSDADRSSCSLSDQGEGLMNLYVVVNTQTGLTGVRFAAPKPGCFNATWLADVAAPGYFVIGDSQTDLSIALGVCSPGITHVLTMVFQKTSSTATCCQFPIVAAPSQSDILFTDCAFTETVLPATSGIINGDETCPCGEVSDLPPTVPANPSPSNGTINLPVSVPLVWLSEDPEGQPLHYDLYFGDTASPPLLASGLTQAGYDVGPLAYETTYYWKVVAMDPADHASVGPVWSFQTGVEGDPPSEPVNLAPADGATDQLRVLRLTWTNGSVGGPVFGYDVHLGTTVTPPLVATLTTLEQSLSVDSLALDTTYYWYVVAKGEGIQQTAGPLWSFHTVATNPLPSAPSAPKPPDHATGVGDHLSLQWTSADPESQPLEFDVYFGTDPDPQSFTHTTVPIRAVTGLAPLTDYYWRVVAIDPEGGSTGGPIWTFRTASGEAPSVPVLVAPLEGTIVSPRSTHLEWSASDPQGGPLLYDIYIGTTTTPPLVFNDRPWSSIDLLADLEENAVYYWKVVARDQDDFETEGPLWSFATRELVPPLPPTNPAPADGALGVARKPLLTWECSDPDSQLMAYQVFLGTTPSPTYAGLANEKSWDPTGSSPLNALLPGQKYYWKIIAYDADENSTPGPVWSFTTSNSDLAPTTPSNPSPPDLATGQPDVVTLQWESSDPEGLGLRYNVYFGTSSTPPLAASNVTDAAYSVTNLLPLTDYHWKIVARDVDNNAVTGPTWTFRTSGFVSSVKLGLYADASGTSCSLADVGSGVRNVYVVLDGPSQYTGVRFSAPTPACFNATWLYDSSPYVAIGNSPTDVSLGFGVCLDVPLTVMTITFMSVGNSPGCCDFPLEAPAVIGKMLATDCSFQEVRPDNEPILGISSDGGCPPCETSGFLRVAEAADTCGSVAPRTVTVDLELSPLIVTNDGYVNVTFSPSLTFVSCERGDLTQDWPTFDSQVNQGVLTIQGAGPGITVGTMGVFARIIFETDCCSWSSPAQLGLSNAQGDFANLRLVGRQLACTYAPDGDVNGDGSVTVADAQCALDTYLFAPFLPPSGCGGPGAAMRADVDCSGVPTPGDAYCIFRQWLDQSCEFCTGGAMNTASAPAPHLALRAVREVDDWVVVLRASGLQSLGAIGFEMQYPDDVGFVSVEPSRNDVFAALQTRLVAPGRVRVGAYANGGPVPIGNGDVLAIRLRGSVLARGGTVTVEQFADDLAGAQPVSTALGAATGPSVNHVVLHQNSPNPFNPSTSIRFELPHPMHVRLSIFDVHGKLVKMLLDERRDAGASDVEWNGTDGRGETVATGVYFYVLDTGGKRYQHKMVLLK